MTTGDDDPLVRALGGAFGIIGALLERANVATLDEFSRALGVYSAVTNETDAAAADIIAQWVVTLEEFARRGQGIN